MAGGTVGTPFDGAQGKPSADGLDALVQSFLVFLERETMLEDEPAVTNIPVLVELPANCSPLETEITPLRGD